MHKGTLYFGIDISKEAFDVTDSNNRYFQFENNHRGFKKLLKLLDQNKSLCDGGYKILPLSIGLFFTR